MSRPSIPTPPRAHAHAPRPVIYVPKALAERAKREGVDLDKFYLEHYGADWRVEEPMPLSRPVAMPAGKPGCKDCCGIGVVHVQVKGQLRVERKPCPCTIEQQFNQVREERLRSLQRDMP
jgi:hypothetical protein